MDTISYNSFMDFWQKQGKDPLFPDLLWSRPENKRTAGKLLIIGGNLHTFSAPGRAYDAAVEAGIGTAKVLLPEGLRKTIGTILENGEFAPMNKSGSFAKDALAEWLDWSRWADAVLLAGDVGRNSETAIVLESFIKSYSGPLVITQDCLDQLSTVADKVYHRPNTVIVASFGQLQKAWPKLGLGIEPIRYQWPLQRNLDLLHQATKELPAAIITKHNDDLIVAAGGNLSTTTNADKIWRIETAAKAATWWLQNPTKQFEALTTSVV